jgi:excisionase family DNA binding protein
MAELTNTEDTAAALGDVHPETVRRLWREGRIPGYKLGRLLKFDVDEVRAALRATPGTGTTPAALAEPDFDAIDAKPLNRNATTTGTLTKRRPSSSPDQRITPVDLAPE